MNKSYISVWNDASGTWVAAPETAKTHCGSGVTASSCSVSSNADSGPATPLKAMFMPIAMAIGAAMMPSMTFAQAVTGNGGLELCPAGIGGMGSSWGPLSSAVGAMSCGDTTGDQSGNGFSFSLNNGAATNGAWGYADGAITARVTGFDDGRLQLLGMGGIQMLNTVTMTGHKITSLAAGDYSLSSADAVNGAQLYQYTRYFQANSPSADPSTSAQAKGANSVASGPSSMAVGSNSSAYGANAVALVSNSVALGANSVASRNDTVSVGYLSADGSSQYTRQITNVTAGAAGTDAVNVNQLNAAIASVNGGGGGGGAVANAVVYDSSASTLITLKGSGGTKITNLTAGDISSGWSTDAVNGSQLYQTNQNVANVAGNLANLSGNVANVTNVVNNIVNNGIAGNPLVVTYDTTSRNTVTLGGVGATKAVKLTNVAAGDISTVSSTDAVNGGQLYTTNQNLEDLANNVGNIATFINTNGIKYFHTNTSLADSSAVGANSVAIGGQAIANGINSVALGSNSLADRSNAVSVGAAGSERQIINVAAGTANTDAVNLAQMNAAIATASTGGSGSPDAVIYDSSAHDKLTLGGRTSTVPVGLTNLAAGQVASSSKDAVNGSQLFNTASSVANALGGGSSVSASGAVTNPTYTLQGGTFNDVGSALSGLDTEISGLSTDVANTSKYVKVVSASSAAIATGSEAVALGGGAYASGTNSIAIGSGSRSMFANSVALGANSRVNAANTVSIGDIGTERRITNVANGVSGTDAATIAQLSALQTSVNQQIAALPSGSKSMLMGASMLGATPVTAYISVSSNVTAGTNTSTDNSQDAMAIGPTAMALGQGSLAVGAGAGTALAGSTAVGNGAAALALNTTVIGAGANTSNNATNAVAIGYNAAAQGANALSLGSSAVSNGSGSIAMGANAFVTTTASNALALGAGATVSQANTVALGANSVGDRANAISVGSSTAQRQITYVANGTNSTDAVNVSQLTGVTNLIGGGAGVNADGTIKKPAFTIGGQTYSDVGSAIAAAVSGGSANAVQYDTSSHTKVTLGGTGTTVPVTLTNVANGVANSDAVNVAQLQAMGGTINSSGVVTNAFVAYDDTTKNTVTLKGASGSTKITGLTAGALSATSLDAVNGTQLYQTNANVANVAGTVANVTNTVNNITNGGGIKYFHANSTLADSSAGGTNSVAIGGAANASANNSVALGSNSVANRANAVSVGAVGSERQIINVANGTNGTDAVNVSQLQAMGANITSGVVTNAFVAYDDSTKGKVTFGGTGATKAVTLTNVANGVASSDAVNVAQLQAMGGTINSSGVVTNAFVAYDDTTKNTITLQGASGSTKITGLTAGALSATSSDAVNGSQLYRTATSVANALGGGSSMGLNGTVSAPSYQLSGGTYSDVGSALSGLDGEISSINNNIADTTKYIKVVSNSSAAIATGGEAVAIGGGAYASGLNSLSLGSGARSQFANSVALGANSRVTVANTISVGDVGTERRIMNVANGVLSSDAATLGQLNALQNSLTQKVSAESSGVKSMLLGAVPVTNYIAVSTTITPGLPATTTDNTENAMAIGPGAMAQGAGSVVVGAGSGSFHAGSTVIGSSAVAGAVNATVIGGGATTNNSADNSVVIGYMAAAQGTNALALGSNSVTNATNSVGLGANAVVTTTGTNSMALGSASTVSGVNAVAIGYNSTADRANTVSVGASGSTRQIVNVAAGSQDTDAVNLGQMNTAINAIAGGGAPNAVVYDTSAHTALTLNKGAGAVTVSNVADGVANNDAVNVEQLKAMGATIGTSGAVTNAFVAYDSTTKSKITLGGTSSTVPVALTNVAAGQITSSSKDAINGSQLYNVASSTAAALGGGSTMGSDGKISTPSYTLNGKTYTDVGAALVAAASGGSPDAVVYDTSAHTALTLNKGAGAVTVSNVADGSANHDAVNVEQLKAMGAAIGTSGVVTNSFVAYDDTNKGTVTFGGVSATTPVILANVGNGQVTSTSKQAINGSQLYGASSSVAAALGGASSVGSDGKVTASFKLDGSTYTSVGATLDALNSKIGTGSTDGVVYDTPAHDKLTLGGANATTPVTIANVAAATSDDQAVNLKQLKEAGLNVDTSGNVTSSFIAYDNASKNTVTFGGVGSTTPVLLKNVAAGIADSDAVNVGQMHSYVDQQIGGGTANGVAYDDSTKSKVTLGGVGSTTPVTLTNVAAGKAATDAVNYGQFSALENVVANIQPGTGNSTYININPTSGGTAAVATGSDSIAIGNGASASGESAIAIGKNTVTSGDNSVAMGAGASAPNTNAVALGANSTTDRDNSVSVGSAGAERQITNVAAGTQGTDAVNLNQLNSAMGNMSNSINNVDRSAAKGIASASALNIVTPYLPGRTTLNAGVANYRGYQAIGLGVSRWNEKGTINYNLGVSTSGGNSTIVRAGIGIVLGN